MENMKTDRYISLLSAALLLLPLQAIGFDFVRAEQSTIPVWQPAEWSYQGEKGQAHWSELSTSFQECEAGLKQSPVDIREVRFTHLPSLKFSYRTSMMTIYRKPEQLWLKYDHGSSLKVGPKRYKFVGFDFHTPGEHSFRGRKHDMEIHMHHLGDDGEPLIVAIPVNGGHRKNITLTRIGEHIPRMQSHMRSRRIGLNAMFLLPSDRSYYSYQGSETRPPCTEGVQWIVMKNPIRVSWDEINLFKSIVGVNARDTQPLNNRVILSSSR